MAERENDEYQVFYSEKMLIYETYYIPYLYDNI